MIGTGLLNKVIDILGTAGVGVEVDAEGDVEAPVTLTADQKAQLAWAAARGRVVLRVLASAKSGSPSFTLDSLSISKDGTNYAVAQYFNPISVTADGEKEPVEIVAALLQAAKLRLDSTVVQLSGSHKITLAVQLELAVKD